MSDKSLIEWTDATWNPVTGCSIVSPGCTKCYAMKLAGTRLKHHPTRKGLTTPSKAGPVWNGEVRFNEAALPQPLKWTRPRMIFVCAHGDLFHESVPDAWIDQVFAIMALCPQHTFQVLTKRSARMLAYLSAKLLEHRISAAQAILPFDFPSPGRWPHLPLTNVWLGVSAEDQKRANERIPDLLQTPAAIRFVSAEPLIGPIDLTRMRPAPAAQLYGFPNVDALRGSWFVDGHLPDDDWEEENGLALDWVIVGGESGKDARPMLPDWARLIRDQCAAAAVPFFYKQWGNWLDADQLLSRIEFGAGSIVRDGQRWNPPRPLNFADAAFLADTLGHPYEHRSDGHTLLRMTKARAGRLLDGIEHNGMPAIRERPFR